MGIICVELIKDFKSTDGVHLALDGEGLEIFRSALAGVAKLPGAGGSSIVYDQKIHRFVIDECQTKIFVGHDSVNWNLPREKIDEILASLDTLGEAAYACHDFIDIDSPRDTLLISKDEYVGRIASSR